MGLPCRNTQVSSSNRASPQYDKPPKPNTQLSHVHHAHQGNRAHSSTSHNPLSTHANIEPIPPPCPAHSRSEDQQSAPAYNSTPSTPPTRTRPTHYPTRRPVRSPTSDLRAFWSAAARSGIGARRASSYGEPSPNRARTRERISNATRERTAFAHGHARTGTPEGSRAHASERAGGGGEVWMDEERTSGRGRVLCAWALDAKGSGGGERLRAEGGAPELVKAEWGRSVRVGADRGGAVRWGVQSEPRCG